MSARYRPDSRSAGRPMSVPMTAGDDARDQQHQHGNGSDGHSWSKRTATQAPTRPAHELAQRDHPDPADQQAEAEGDDAVDDDRRHDLQPVAGRACAGSGERARLQEERERHSANELKTTAHAIWRIRFGAMRTGPMARARRRSARRCEPRSCQVCTTTWRCRANHSSAMIASTNGVIVRYGRVDQAVFERGEARLHDADHEAGDQRDPQRA